MEKSKMEKSKMEKSKMEKYKMKKYKIEKNKKKTIPLEKDLGMVALAPLLVAPLVVPGAEGGSHCRLYLLKKKQQ